MNNLARLCEDGHWRQLAPIKVAIESGYTLLTLEKLRLKFPLAKFDNLLMCKYVDGAQSVFTLSRMLACTVDPLIAWPDFDPTCNRLFGQQRV